jgi:hypothetical protein
MVFSLVGKWVGIGVRGVFERRGREGFAENAEEEKKFKKNSKNTAF